MFQPMPTDLAEAVRRASAAEQRAARGAGHAQLPKLPIGSSPRRAALPVTVTRQRSPTDDPAPSGQRRCRAHTRSIATSCKRQPLWLSISIGSHDYLGNTRTCQRRQRFRRKPAAASGTRASSMLGIRRLHPAGSPAGRGCPVGRQRLPGGSFAGAPSPSARRRIWRERFCAHSRSIPIRDQRELQVGWARVVRVVRLPPTISLDFSRSKCEGYERPAQPQRRTDVRSA